jgi:hypothetical protein
MIFHSQTLIFFSMQEFLVKSADRVELMAMLGLFGAIISAIQMYPWFFIIIWGLGDYVVQIIIFRCQFAWYISYVCQHTVFLFSVFSLNFSLFSNTFTNNSKYKTFFINLYSYLVVGIFWLNKCSTIVGAGANLLF